MEILLVIGLVFGVFATITLIGILGVFLKFVLKVSVKLFLFSLKGLAFIALAGFIFFVVFSLIKWINI